jgi:hypothetical protein
LISFVSKSIQLLLVSVGLDTGGSVFVFDIAGSNVEILFPRIILVNLNQRRISAIASSRINFAAPISKKRQSATKNIYDSIALNNSFDSALAMLFIPELPQNSRFTLEAMVF